MTLLSPGLLRDLFSSFRSALPPSILRSLPPTDCWSFLPMLSPLQQPHNWSRWWGWVSSCSIICHPPTSSVIFRKHTPDSQAKGLHCNKCICGPSQAGPPSVQQPQLWSLPSLSVPREPETRLLFAQCHSRDPHTLGKAVTPVPPHSWHYCTHIPALFISTQGKESSRPSPPCLSHHPKPMTLSQPPLPGLSKELYMACCDPAYDLSRSPSLGSCVCHRWFSEQFSIFIRFPSLCP